MKFKTVFAGSLLFASFFRYSCTLGNSQVVVIVKDAQNKAVENAVVSVGSFHGKSDVDGKISADKIPAGQYVIRVEAPGFAPVGRRIQIGEDQTLRVDFFLSRLKKVELGQLNSEKAIYLDELIVRIPKASLRDAQGNIAPEATMEFVVPKLTGEDIRVMPGNFIGVRKNQEAGDDPVSIESAGVFFMRFSYQGKELQPAQPVVVAIPVQGAFPGKTIPLWSFNEETGLWQEEGVAQKIQYKGKTWFRGAMDHFSWWNCDQPLSNTSTIWIKSFVNESGEELKIENMEAFGIDYLGRSSISDPVPNLVNENGPGKCINVKINSRVKLRVESSQDMIFYQFQKELRSKNVPAKCGVNPQDGVIIEKVTLVKRASACITGRFHLQMPPQKQKEFTAYLLGWYKNDTVLFDKMPVASDGKSEFCFGNVPVDFDLQLRVSEWKELDPSQLWGRRAGNVDQKRCELYSAFSVDPGEGNQGNCSTRKNLCIDIGELQGEFSCF